MNYHWDAFSANWRDTAGIQRLSSPNGPIAFMILQQAELQLMALICPFIDFAIYTLWEENQWLHFKLLLFN